MDTSFLAEALQKYFSDEPDIAASGRRALQELGPSPSQIVLEWLYHKIAGLPDPEEATEYFFKIGLMFFFYASFLIFGSMALMRFFGMFIGICWGFLGGMVGAIFIHKGCRAPIQAVVNRFESMPDASITALLFYLDNEVPSGLGALYDRLKQEHAERLPVFERFVASWGAKRQILHLLRLAKKHGRKLNSDARFQIYRRFPEDPDIEAELNPHLAKQREALVKRVLASVHKPPNGTKPFEEFLALLQKYLKTKTGFWSGFTPKLSLVKVVRMAECLSIDDFVKALPQLLQLLFLESNLRRKSYQRLVALTYANLFNLSPEVRFSLPPDIKARIYSLFQPHPLPTIRSPRILRLTLLPALAHSMANWGDQETIPFLLGVLRHTEKPELRSELAYAIAQLTRRYPSQLLRPTLPPSELHPETLVRPAGFAPSEDTCLLRAADLSLQSSTTEDLSQETAPSQGGDGLPNIQQ